MIKSSVFWRARSTQDLLLRTVHQERRFEMARPA